MISVRRKRGQGIVLDGGIKIEIVAIQGREVVVHIHKPREVRVMLEEEVDPRQGPPPPNTPAYPGPRPSRAENLIARSREQNTNGQTAVAK